jgi:amino acid adenylation domain-containing protein
MPIELPGNPLLPASQRALIASVNATDGPVSEALLYTHFLTHVRQQPERLALYADGCALSYGELYQRARALADQLAELGVRARTLVAVVMRKGWEQVVGALGVLLAGAAYLPLDTQLSNEQLQPLLDETEVKIALTQTALIDDRSWPSSVRTVAIDSPAAHDEFLSYDPLQASASVTLTPDDLAYVIYTRCGDDQLKGAMITHRGAVNTILDINERFTVGSEDQVLGLSPLTCDLSVYDIFGALAAGATLVLPPASSEQKPEVWLELIKREGVTIWNSKPDQTSLMIDAASGLGTELSSLRLALVSGDRIESQLPKRLREFAPGCELISLGATVETSIWSSLHREDQADANRDTLPLGRPMRNQRMYILNERYQLCPVWVRGQLYIAGLGLGPGYWADPEQTHESFVMHPTTGERMFRSGNLGMYLPNEEIEFLGRENLQLNVNGYQIDPQEIEPAPLRNETQLSEPTSNSVSDVIDIACELLGQMPISANDRLLALGADSLLLILLANRLEAQFGKRPDLSFLFTNPTIAELAQHCTNHTLND